MAEEERGDYYTPPTLGELSRSLAYERGELADYDLKGPQVPPAGPGGPTAVADLNRATGIIETITNERISPRPPALLYQVISTYDSRPIQAYDFQSSGCELLQWTGTPPTFPPINLTYVVPTNVVAVVRWFRYQVMNGPVNAVVEGDCWLQSDIFVNDLPVREYNKMLHPVLMTNFFPCFIIVNELLDIRLQLSIFDPNNTEFSQALDDTNAVVQLEMYGQLLLKTGVPIDFEIANAIGGGQL
jgi:hypothetical protein